MMNLVASQNASETASPAPRKVIVGTSIFSVFESQRPFSSLGKRIEEIRERVAAMSADAKAKFGRGLDVAVLPENVLNPNADGRSVWERAVGFDESVQSKLGQIARENGTYLVVSFNMREQGTDEAVSNVAVLFNRSGALEGIYRKVFLVPDSQGELEGGKVPGTEYPVFDTDFGRVGLAICFDMGFDELMEAYARQGVELILWPTMSPQTLLPRAYARRFGFYLVSATPRDNASVFDPAGEIAAQTRVEGPVTAEIDLSYEIVHWVRGLNGGDSLTQKFGNRVGYRYSDTEDTGIFWSNDPTMPIGEMLKSIGVPSVGALRDYARVKREAELTSQSAHD